MLALLYIVKTLAERGGGRSILEEELFHTLYRLWVDKQYALYSDYHQVLNALEFLASLGFIEIETEGGKRRIRITDRGLEECEKISPIARERIPLI